MLQVKFACLLFTFVRAIDEQYTEPCINDNDEALITSMRQTMLALNEQMQVLETNLKSMIFFPKSYYISLIYKVTICKNKKMRND